MLVSWPFCLAMLKPRLQVLLVDCRLLQSSPRLPATERQKFFVSVRLMSFLLDSWYRSFYTLTLALLKLYMCVWIASTQQVLSFPWQNVQVLQSKHATILSILHTKFKPFKRYISKCAHKQAHLYTCSIWLLSRTTARRNPWLQRHWSWTPSRRCREGRVSIQLHLTPAPAVFLASCFLIHDILFSMIHGFSACPIRAQLRLLDCGGIRYDICEVSASCISWNKKTWDSHIAAVVWPSGLHGCRFWFWRNKALFNVKLFCKFHIVPRLNRVDFAIGFLTQPPLSRVTDYLTLGRGQLKRQQQSLQLQMRRPLRVVWVSFWFLCNKLTRCKSDRRQSEQRNLILK